MTPLVDRLASYAEYHRGRRNIATHCVAVLEQPARRDASTAPSSAGRRWHDSPAPSDQ